MSEPRDSNAVLETVRVREVVGVVRGHENLERIAEELMRAGFDRSDIELMASRDAVLRKLKTVYLDPAEISDAAGVPRRELRTRDDETSTTALVFGTLTGIGSIGAAIPVVASGGALAVAAAAAAAGGLVSAGIAKAIRDRIVDREDTLDLEEELAGGGVVVFVRVRTPEMENRAAAIMRKLGGRQVHSHEVELAKSLEDIPLSRLTPDPWLGDERLGEV